MRGPGAQRKGLLFWAQSGACPSPAGHLHPCRVGSKPGLTDMAKCSGVLPCSPRASALAPCVSSTMTQSKRLRMTATCRAVFPTELVLFTSQPRFSSRRAICGDRVPARVSGVLRVAAACAPGGTWAGPLPSGLRPLESSSNGRSQGGRPQLWGWPQTLPPTPAAPQELGDKKLKLW